MLRIYNTLTRKKEIFRPIKDKQVGIYTCGPTVYNHVHIGNLRAYVFADLLQRYLKYSGYKVKWVLNITDIEDKIIRDYKKSGKSLKEFTRYYEKLFFEDIEKINIGKVDFYKIPRATEHIKEMQEIIKKLLKNNLAYESEGSIYFSIQKYIKSGKKYGQLLNIDLKGFKEGVRIDADEYGKENAKDFVLWKAKKSDEPSWDFKIENNNFPGRPGWHMECSAMSSKYLGQPFDIHTGGVDLIFPHHEDEIAQSEGATGKKFANYFIHNEHLLVNGHKMSKSLGNFYVLEDIIKKFVKNPLALRLLFLQSHYRSKLNFTKKSIWDAERGIESTYDFLQRLSLVSTEKVLDLAVADLDAYKEDLDLSLNDDLNTPRAIAVVQNLITSANIDLDRGQMNKRQAKKIINFFMRIDEILGLDFKRALKKDFLPEEIKIKIRMREKARKAGDFKKADKLREELLKKGFELEDTPQGVRWKRIK